MYRLFYNLPLLGDVLFIEIVPELEATKTEKKGNVVALYHEDTLIGYNIFNIHELIKLKADGVLFSPDDKLIDVINLILKRQGYETLPYTRDSGYKVAEVVNLEEHPLDEKKTIVTLKLKEKTILTDTRYQNLQIGCKVVIALEGTILADGSIFHESVVRNIPHQADICSGKDLRLNEDGKSAFLPDQGEKEGDDFFLGEV